MLHYHILASVYMGNIKTLCKNKEFRLSRPACNKEFEWLDQMFKIIFSISSESMKSFQVILQSKPTSTN